MAVSYTHLDVYKRQGIQTMNKIIEKLEKKIPKWIRNKLEETKSVLECFFHQDKKYVLHLKQDHDHRIILCLSLIHIFNRERNSQKHIVLQISTII